MIALAYYLLKVIICSGILFLYYHLALRNKLFHQWNRFYLLIAVVISLIAPIIQLSVLHHSAEESNNAIKLLQVISSADGYMDEIVITTHRSVPTEQWILVAYCVISLVLLVSVLMSLVKIYSIIKSHSCKWIDNIRFISTNVQGTPFSFFRFIFWNNSIDLSTQTGQQIFEHELVHVQEKHSADKLFIQFILVIFWCNPFFWLIRRELKLIHEFIADKKAVGEHGAAALAAMILNSSYPTQFNSLTNQFFQTSIKRRLAMLSRIHNPRINYISRVLALAIVTATVLAFTIKTKTVQTPFTKLEKTITVVIDAGHGLMPDGKYNGGREENVYEDQIVLSIANKIKSLNNDSKLKIVLTRTSDNIVDLHKRVDIAKENNADLFISLHTNVAPDLYKDSAGMNGMEVMVSNKNTAYQQASEILGSVLQQQLSSVYFVKPALIKRQVGVWVLDHNVCPSVLIECGFLTNEKDRDFITKDENQNAVAEKILQSIETYAANEHQTQRNEVDTVPESQVKVTTTSQDKNEKGSSFSVKYDSQKKAPLYIVDGKEYNGSLDDINANDIQSISVLKDDSAIKKYGKKGENGVIEIILKKKRKEITKSDEVVTIVNSSANDTIPKKEPVFSKVEVEASVDRTEWQQFLSKNLQSAIESAAKKGMKSGTYTVNVKFLVKKDGSVADVKAINETGYGLSEASVAAVRTGPKWKPGLQNGKVVNSYHTQPITFVIQEQ